MKYKVAFFGFFLAALCMGLVGCKSLEEKVCNHLGEFVDDGDYDVEECMSDIGELKEECANYEEVMNCLLEKDSEGDLRECNQLCEEAEEEEEAE